MANFETASDALTTALAIVDDRLTDIDIDEQLELYLELIDRRAKIQNAIGAGGGGSSSITTNSSIEYNTGAATSKTQRVAIAQTQTTLAQLAAVGSSAAVSMAGYKRAFITLLVASINTNVVVRIEGSNDGTNWTNLSANNTDTTITTNGCYGFNFEGCPASIRVTFVSESGGTAATIDAIVRVSA